MYRQRNESRWDPLRHESVQSFLDATFQPGVHSIAHGIQYLDVLIEDRQSTTTMVVFNSALTEKVPTVPVFTGRTLAEATGVNLVAISDPSIGMGDIDVAWYLGNRVIGHLRPVLSPIISHIIHSIGTRRLILFGASGGGYAVGNFAHDFPGCIAIAVNPRLNLRRKPAPDISTYLKICHQAASKTPMIRIRKQYIVDDVSSLASAGLNHHFLLYQNSNDSIFLNHQALPFINSMDNEPNLHVRFSPDNLGHSQIPANIVRHIIGILSNQMDNLSSIRAAGFQNSCEALLNIPKKY